MRTIRALLKTTCLLALTAGAAFAQVDVDLAFNPDTASPGDPVTLFASIANLSSEPTITDFTVAMTFGELSIGPLPFRMPLPAGLERSVEIPFVVPPLPMGGTLTVTVTATANGATDTATTSLTIVSSDATVADAAALRQLGTSVGAALLGNTGTVATQNSTVSEVKNLYR